MGINKRNIYNFGRKASPLKLALTFRVLLDRTVDTSADGSVTRNPPKHPISPDQMPRHYRSPSGGKKKVNKCGWENPDLTEFSPNRGLVELYT